ncbi:MAG: type II secretion system protein, partial [Candidatus Liptonbacteria bacterium]
MRVSRFSGFTLVEMLVTIGIMAIISSAVIIYSASSRQQIGLAAETAKLTQFILRAKSLSISTYGATQNICGYGVQLDYANNRYHLVSYALNSCDSPNSISARNILETHRLMPGVTLSNLVSGNRMGDVLFLPPDPIIFTTDLNGNLYESRGAKVKLITADGVASKNISVNS